MAGLDLNKMKTGRSVFGVPVPSRMLHVRSVVNEPMHMRTDQLYRVIRGDLARALAEMIVAEESAFFKTTSPDIAGAPPHHIVEGSCVVLTLEEIESLMIDCYKAGMRDAVGHGEMPRLYIG